MPSTKTRSDASAAYERGRESASGKFTMKDPIDTKTVKTFMTNPAVGPLKSQAPSAQPPASPAFPGNTGNVNG